MNKCKYQRKMDLFEMGSVGTLYGWNTKKMDLIIEQEQMFIPVGRIGTKK